MKVTAVVPAYNEAKTISQVVDGIKQVVDQVVVVDDGSKDDTGSLAKIAGATVFTHFLNRGQGAALQTGLEAAVRDQADIVVTFDADGQHDPGDIKAVIEPIIRDQADIVLGSRFLSDNNQIPISKTVILKIAAGITRFYTGLAVTDAHNGFRAFSKKAAQLINIEQDGMAHASEIIEQIKKHQLIIKEIPVTIQYTEYSQQKGQRITNSFKIIWDLILGRVK